MKLFLLFTTLFTLHCHSQDTLSVYFALNQSTLSRSEEEKLKTFAADQSILVKEIAAHSDSSASISYNKELAEKRLKHVKSYFQEGLRVIETVYGEKQSSQSRTYSASDWRRVDIVYTRKGQKIPIKKEALTNETPSKKLSRQFTLFLNDTTLNEVIIRLSILFYSNKDIYYAKYEKELVRLFEFMRDNPTISAHIRGHVCCGDDYQLSSNRAFVVYKYLKKSGIDPSRMSFRGYSNKKPVVYPERTERDRLANRRVDIIFSKTH